MPVDERRRRTTMHRRRVRSLLDPIAAFLHAGGLTKKECLAAFSAALDAFQTSTENRRMDHIGHPTPYADIIAAWTRDERFVDASGSPRVLSVSGRNGFTSLVKKISPRVNAKAALSVLTRYRTVRRLQDGRYRLTNPFFYTNSDKATAFEPIAFFLSDACSTLARILKRRERTLQPERFWRKVDATVKHRRRAELLTADRQRRRALFAEKRSAMMARRQAKAEKKRADFSGRTADLPPST